MTTLPMQVTSAGTVVASGGLPGGSGTLIAPSTNTDTIWLDSTTVTQAQGIPLTPGSSQPWPNSLPLYAWTPSGTQMLFVAPGVEQGTNAGAIASQLIAQGLTPQAIAQQINLAGVPIVDKLTAITSGTQTTNGSTIFLPAQDTSAFQTLHISCYVHETASAGTPPGTGACLIYHYDSGGNLVGQDVFNFLADNTLGADYGPNITVPCRGAQVVVGFIYTASGRTLTYQLNGSYRPTDRMGGVLVSGYWSASGHGTALDQGLNGYVTWTSGNIPANTTYREWPNTRPGAATFTIDTTNGPMPAGGMDLFLVDQQLGQTIAGIHNAAAGTVYPYAVVLPARPVAFSARNKDATNATANSPMFTLCMSI